jgi:hypothetical protein
MRGSSMMPTGRLITASSSRVSRPSAPVIVARVAAGINPVWPAWVVSGMATATETGAGAAPELTTTDDRAVPVSLLSRVSDAEIPRTPQPSRVNCAAGMVAATSCSWPGDRLGTGTVAMMASSSTSRDASAGESHSDRPARVSMTSRSRATLRVPPLSTSCPVLVRAAVIVRSEPGCSTPPPAGARTICTGASAALADGTTELRPRVDAATRPSPRRVGMARGRRSDGGFIGLVMPRDGATSSRF